MRGLIVLLAVIFLLGLATYALFDRARGLAYFLLSIALGLGLLFLLAVTQVI